MTPQSIPQPAPFLAKCRGSTGGCAPVNVDDEDSVAPIEEPLTQAERATLWMLEARGCLQ